MRKFVLPFASLISAATLNFRFPLLSPAVTLMKPSCAARLMSSIDTVASPVSFASLMKKEPPRARLKVS